MGLKEIIVENYPELDDGTPLFELGIILRDDSDGEGAYIEKWNYEKPIPKGLKLGK